MATALVSYRPRPVLDLAFFFDDSGDEQLALGRRRLASAMFRVAKVLYALVRDDDGFARASIALAIIASEAEDWGRARAQLTTACARFEKNRRVDLEAHCAGTLAEIHCLSGELDLAVSRYRKASRLAMGSMNLKASEEWGERAEDLAVILAGFAALKGPS